MKHERILTAASILGLAALGGCGSIMGKHGDYTEEQRNAAKVKLDGIKAGLEYQAALGDLEAGDLPKALKSVENSLAILETQPKAWTLRGRILLESGNIAGALQSFARSEELDTNLVDTHYFLGIANERLERKEEALKRYLRAAELDEGNAQYATAAAEVMIDLGRTAEARTYLEQRGTALVDNAAVRQVLGHLAMMDKDFARAETLFNEARLLSPNDLTVLEDLTRSQIALSKFADAEIGLKKLLNDPKTSARRDLQHARAKCLIETDRLVDAREILIRLCNDQQGSADVEAWADLGQVSHKLNDFNRVRTAGNKLIAIAPSSPEGYLLRGLWERQRGDLRAAKDSVNAAIERGPSADAYLLLSSIQIDLRDQNGAAKTLRLALANDPSNRTAAEMLRTIEGGSATANADVK
jgi:tetratricopeptide (TPR) repeat protein